MEPQPPNKPMKLTAEPEDVHASASAASLVGFSRPQPIGQDVRQT